LEDAHAWADPHVALSESCEVGEDGVVIGENVMGLHPIRVHNLEEEIEGRKREPSLHPSLGDPLIHFRSGGGAALDVHLGFGAIKPLS
jgi:hypothetical protein